MFCIPTSIYGARPRCASRAVRVTASSGSSFRRCATYAEEAFASTDPLMAGHGVVLVRLTLVHASGRSYKAAVGKDKDPASTQPVEGVEAAENLLVATKDFDEKVEALVEGPEQFALKNNRLIAPDGKTMCAMIYPRWIINPGRGALI